MWRELLSLWTEVLAKNEIALKENAKVESIQLEKKAFIVKTQSGIEYTTRKVLLAIGRRGTPRKLNVPGEESPKVAYRLIEPEVILNKRIVVVGGGDSAIESALLLCDQNSVTLSYRGELFGRLKPRNQERIKEAIAANRVSALMNTNVIEIADQYVKLMDSGTGMEISLENDLIFIFAGGELPIQFLEKIGIQITKKFGEAILKHEK